MNFEPEMIEVCDALGLPLPPREGPCWCNGPYSVEANHHEWCRTNRAVWRSGIAALGTVNKVGDNTMDYLTLAFLEGVGKGFSPEAACLWARFRLCSREPRYGLSVKAGGDVAEAP